jgi:dihydrodipicolinate synthase/N-acetylneuraminate lyase
MPARLDESVAVPLRQGTVIPALPLALTEARRLDERRQRGLIRYYAAAGAGGLAVGVHTTQFAIRDPAHGLLRPVLELAREELDRADLGRASPLIRVAGICGATAQAVREAEQARDLGYHLGLLSLSALRGETVERWIDHARAVGEVIPVFGFYLQSTISGMTLPFDFWRRLAELDALAAVKIAPFDRYRTIDVVRAVAEAGRDDVALYTGNDDQIVLDLLTSFRFDVAGRKVTRRIVGGLLGQWAVWTHAAVALHARCRELAAAEAPIPAALLTLAAELTDANAAIFDAANNFAGCIPGIHEVLWRQGLLAGTWCLDPREALSPGQAEAIERVSRADPHLTDDAFVRAHRDDWLRG